MSDPYVYQSGEVYGEPERPTPRIQSRVPKPTKPLTPRQRLVKAAVEGTARRRKREQFDPRWNERTPQSQRLALKQDAADDRDLAQRKDSR